MSLYHETILWPQRIGGRRDSFAGSSQAPKRAVAVGRVLVGLVRSHFSRHKARSHQRSAAALSMKINGAAVLKCFASLFCMLSRVGA